MCQMTARFSLFLTTKNIIQYSGFPQDSSYLELECSRHVNDHAVSLNLVSGIDKSAASAVIARLVAVRSNCQRIVERANYHNAFYACNLKQSLFSHTTSISYFACANVTAAITRIVPKPMRVTQFVSLFIFGSCVFRFTSYSHSKIVRSLLCVQLSSAVA